MLKPITSTFNGLSKSELICILICLASLILLFATTVLSIPTLIYDEPWYLNIVKSLHDQGLSTEFLRNLPGPTGPLHTFVHYLFEPLTQLKAPSVRLVNNFLLILLFTTQFFTLKHLGAKTPLISSLSIMATPMIWVISGMALTEIPAMLFASVSVLLLLLSLTNPEEQRIRSYLFSSLGGLSLGLSILGRQPFLTLLLALPVLLLKPNKYVRTCLLLFTFCALLLPFIVFYLWGGIVPPTTANVGKGISISNGLLSYAYAGIMTAILAPKWFNLELRTNLIIVLVALASNLVFGFIEIVPLYSVVKSILPPILLTVYSRFLSGLLVLIALLFMFSTLKNMWNNRINYTFIFICLSASFIVGAAFKITHIFSSRYPATALPLIILAVEQYSPVTKWKAVRLIIGVIFGWLSLLSYFNYSK